jgi:hypothetical protein
MSIIPVRFRFLLKGIFLLSILCTLTEFDVKGDVNITDNKGDPPFAYDQIPVRVMVEGYKTFYVDAIYANNDLLYVDILELFTTLNIPCTAGDKGNIITGFIEDERRSFSINFDTKQIKVGDKIIDAKNGLVKETGTLFMETALFAETFGITLTFNYRSLIVTLKSNFELPVIKQMRVEKMRSNLSKIKGEVIADTIFRRDYHLLKLGTFDWLAASFQNWNKPTDNHFSLGVGTELLYGEADIAVNYYSLYKWDNRQLFYLWRWVDNDNSIIKQAQVGKISTQTISFINSPIVGAVVRNSPTTVRKARGYYTISEHTEPNWGVELYINNVMVDYTKADASGLYMFKVPNVYGYTTLKLKFYGPLGEERTEERIVNVPYTVIAAKEFEYGLAGGFLQDSISSRFGRAEINYGVNRILTVGGGVEYLSSISTGPFIPFATATIQPFSKMTLFGEYDYGVKTRGLLNYYFRKDALLEIDYAKFVEGQLATIFNAPEERKIRLSVPFRYKILTGFAKLDYTQLVYKDFLYNQSNIMFSAYYKQFSANSATMFNWIDSNPSYFTTDLALSYRMKKGVTVRPSALYNLSDGKFISCKLALERYFARGNFAISYERNFLYSDHFITLNFKYDLPFARANFTASHSRSNMYTSESVQGSMAFGSGNNYVYASNNSSMSRGGISLYPFLDLNQNGIFDPNEHMVKVTSVRVMGGNALYNEKDSIVRIPDLNAFTDYLVEFQDNNLENIAWRFKKKVYQVLIDPNQFKRIDVPVVSLGEVTGMTYLNKDNTLIGIRRILVEFYKKDSNQLVGETLSESDGYINYMGLEPGEYVARVNSEQLGKLMMVSSPEIIPFKISRSFEGDIVDDINFTLTSTHPQFPVNADSVARAEREKIVMTPEAADSIKSKEQTKNRPYSAVIQVGAFMRRENAIRAERKLRRAIDHPVTIIVEDGFNKVQVSGFAGRSEAIKFLPKIYRLGFRRAYVVRVIQP